MDPISITASALAFATAVKDLVELGQKIHESFAKVSRNRRNAQRTAAKIKEMVEEISVFCEENKDALANMKEFTGALEGLLKKFRGFETSILPLVPQKGGVWKSAAFLRGWWNNNKIETRILELERDIVDVMRRHMMKSAMRTELKQEVHHQETTRRLEDLSSGLAVVRRGVFSLQGPTVTGPIASSSHVVSAELELNVPMFARSTTSTSAPMLRGSATLPEDVMMTMFIKSKITFIATAVEKLSTLPLSGLRRTTRFLLVPNKDFTTDIFHLRRKVVRGVMDIRDLLSDTERSQVIPVDDGIKRLVNLSSQLSILGFVDEAIRVRDWGITLARSLVNVSHSVYDRAILACNLRLQSADHFDHGDKAESRQVIEEALSITGDLLSQSEADAEIRGLHASSLLDYAQFSTDEQGAIKLCIEAIGLLEGIFDVQVFSLLDSLDTPSVVDDVVERVFALSPRPIIVSRCAKAFERLAGSLSQAGDFVNARCSARLCIALHRKIVTSFGQAYRHSLAFTLSKMCEGAISDCFPPTDLHDMAEECVVLFRELAERNPVYYSRRLLRVLWRQAVILQVWGRYVDAIPANKEAVSLAGKFLQDTALEDDALFQLAVTQYQAGRYLDAAHTMTLIPATIKENDGLRVALYADISRGLLRTSHYKESAETAQIAIAFCRKLGIRSPSPQWTGMLVDALSLLAKSQIALGNQPQCILALKESMSIVQDALNPSLDELPIDIHKYLSVFDTHAIIPSLIHQPQLAKLDYTPTQQLQRLAILHPQNKQVFGQLCWSQICYTYNLYRLGRLQDVLQYVNQWQETRTTSPDLVAEFAWALAVMTWIKARALDGHGDREQALSEIRTLHSLSIGPLPTISSMVQESQIQADTGNLEMAQEVMEQYQNFSAFVFASGMDSCTCQSIWALFGAAGTALSCGSYLRAIMLAREAISGSANPHWEAHGSDRFITAVRPSLFSIMSSAQANIGNYNRAIDYAQQAVTLSLDIARRKHDLSSIMGERSLVDSRGYLAEVLLATGDLTQARQICDERRTYFTERVGDRMGEYRDLAPILRVLGVLCCHEGRHEEGEAAAQELTELIQRLGLVFPSLQEQVKIRLRHQASVPILKVLDEMTEKLSCDHQKGIKALFEV